LGTGALLVLLSAVCVSVYFVFQKPYLSKYGALAFTTYAILAGTILALPLMPGLVSQTLEAPIGTTLAMVYLGVFSTAVA
jgi:drug/metabolite transporter (DMT)-like permease